MKRIDMTGQKFGRLTVIAEGGKTKSRNTMWVCRCDCGNITSPINGAFLRDGHTTSCGCLKREKTVSRSTTHGKRNTRIYRIWHDMKTRCHYPKNINFPDYGGRGISVCDEWRSSFVAFYDYVSQLPHFGASGYTLDRINNNGNYEPGNVRWATSVEQRHNRRNGCEKREKSDC